MLLTENSHKGKKQMTVFPPLKRIKILLLIFFKSLKNPQKDFKPYRKRFFSQIFGVVRVGKRG